MANTAGAGVDQDSLTLAHPSAVKQCLVRGDQHQRGGGSLNEIDARWLRLSHLLINDVKLRVISRVAAQTTIAVPDRVTGPIAGNLVANGLYHPGPVKAGKASG